MLAWPWYAYEYGCAANAPRHPTIPCLVNNASYHAAPAQDLLPNATSVGWNDTSGTPYFYYTPAWAAKGAVHRIDYEDARSLTLKNQWARRAGVAGVGMWHADLIDYDNASMVAEYWSPFKAFRGG